MINFFKENISFRIAQKKIMLDWIPSIIESEKKKEGDINLILCDDDYLLEINQQYLKHDTLTDIITFDYCEGNTVSGDIFISIERIKENAKFVGTSINAELTRIVAHGVLHLCGYKDKSKADKKVMTEKENLYLKLLATDFSC